MNCNKYELYERGKLSTSAFDAHAAECPECQRLIAADTELLAIARSLKQPVAAPLLWDKIENQLRTEQQRRQRKAPKVWRYGLRIAAVLMLVFSAGYFLLPERTVPASGLLVNSALERVEAREQAFEHAISELEAVAQPKLSALDLDLQFLYRDKLETIDNQIFRCKKALGQNPANAHIRRYLLAALQDKKNTLKEVVSLGENKR